MVSNFWDNPPFSWQCQRIQARLHPSWGNQQGWLRCPSQRCSSEHNIMKIEMNIDKHLPITEMFIWAQHDRFGLKIDTHLDVTNFCTQCEDHLDAELVGLVYFEIWNINQNISCLYVVHTLTPSWSDLATAAASTFSALTLLTSPLAEWWRELWYLSGEIVYGSLGTVHELRNRG